MAYKFQLGTARLSGSIVPTDDNALDLGESGKEFKDLFIDGTAHLDAINFNGTLISSTAAELNKLDGAGADVTAAKLTTLAALTNTEIGFLDGALSSGVANKAVIMDANKDVGGVRNLTLTGDLTVNGTTTTIDTTTLLVEDSLIEIARGNGGSRASNANAGLYISGSNLDRDVSLQVAADGGRLRVSGSSTVGTGFDIVTGGDYAIGGTSVLNGTTLGSGVLNSSLTSVGTLSTLTVDNVIINGTTIGHTDDGDIITLGDTSVAFANDVDVNIAKAGGLQIAGSAVTATAAELNLLDAGAGSSVAVAAGDGFIMFDATDSNNGKKVLASDIKAYASGLAIYQLSGSGTADGIIGAASGSGYYYNEGHNNKINDIIKRTCLRRCIYDIWFWLVCWRHDSP